MSQRPISITVIAWILIVFGLFGLLGCFAYMGLSSSPIVQQAMALIPVPVSVQIAIACTAVVLRLMTGIGLLLRQGWVRYVFAAYGLAGIGYAYFVSPFTLLLIPGCIIYVAIVVCFFLPGARAYFGKQEATQAAA